MGLLHLFTEIQTVAALNAVTVPREKSSFESQKEITLITYFEVLKYFLVRYAIDHVISKADIEAVWFIQSAHKTVIEYGRLLSAQILCIHRVYDDYAVIGNFVKVLQDNILESLHSLSVLSKHATGQQLV